MNISTIGQLLAALLCIIVGTLTLISPKGFLFRLVSWRYREEEAPKAAPVLDRLGGCLLILLGILLLFV